MPVMASIELAIRFVSWLPNFNTNRPMILTRYDRLKSVGIVICAARWMRSRVTGMAALMLDRQSQPAVRTVMKAQTCSGGLDR